MIDRFPIIFFTSPSSHVTQTDIMTPVRFTKNCKTNNWNASCAGCRKIRRLNNRNRELARCTKETVTKPTVRSTVPEAEVSGSDEPSEETLLRSSHVGHQSLLCEELIIALDDGADISIKMDIT
mmetsp:Transcript_31025/g.82469  ORF Transcript_31025/g.82469 Transcript_31025/m.82469 type:complete len:124 (+) Transcript_31025:2622-2993(+)